MLFLVTTFQCRCIKIVIVYIFNATKWRRNLDNKKQLEFFFLVELTPWECGHTKKIGRILHIIFIISIIIMFHAVKRTLLWFTISHDHQFWIGSAFLSPLCLAAKQGIHRVVVLFAIVFVTCASCHYCQTFDIWK